MADEPMIPATSEHPAIYRDGHRLTANKPAPPRSARDGETLSDDETRKMLDDWRDSMIEVVRLRQEVAALRAELADARADTERLDWLGSHLRYAMVQTDSAAMMSLPNNGRGWENGELRQALDAARAASGEDASHE